MLNLRPVKNLVSGAGMILALGAPLFGGCGPTHFAPVNSVESQKAAGSFLVPAKVDILLAQDDTGSMHGIIDPVTQQLPTFLSNLQKSGWDYRFATTPLTHTRAIDQILASKYDGNWGPGWLPPFPGADLDALWDAGAFVSPSLFSLPGSYSGFLTHEDIDDSSNGNELGFQTIDSVLYDHASSFLREDAMTLVIVLGNGNDISGVNYCRRTDGKVYRCEDVPPGPCASGYGAHYNESGSFNQCRLRTDESSLQGYVSSLRDLKPGNPNALKFFSVVSPKDQNGCLGAHAKAGTRYLRMATATGGWSENICAKPLSSILTTLSSALQAQRLEMRTRYVVVDQEPNLSTVRIYRLEDGKSSSKRLLSPSEYTYEGFRQDFPTVEYPALLNRRTGYFFRLNSPLVGADTAEVVYQPGEVGSSL